MKDELIKASFQKLLCEVLFFVNKFLLMIFFLEDV